SLLRSSVVHFFFFFFSSRRRHTRFSRDWSSDVCSSDLVAAAWFSSAPRFPWTRSCGILTPRGESEMKHKKVELVKERGRWSAKRSEERRVGKECRSRRSR